MGGVQRGGSGGYQRASHGVDEQMTYLKAQTPKKHTPGNGMEISRYQ